MILNVLTFLGAIALFIYGMELMSSGVQKAFGDRLRKFLPWMTGGRVQQVLAGMGITALIQSSNATTLLAVGFVNAGMLTLVQAINVLLGANVGTTVTGWITATAGFLPSISYALIIMGVGFVMNMGKKPALKSIGTFVIGLAIILIAMSFMNKSLPAAGEDIPLSDLLNDLSSKGFISIVIYLIIGILCGWMLHSSPTVAITMILINLGWIGFPSAAAIVLGTNIGTTFKGNIAARSAGTMASRAALSHTVFNALGVILVLLAFRPCTNAVQGLCNVLGLHSPVFHVAMFHTAFNIVMMLIFMWLTEYIEKIDTWMVKDDDKSQGNVFKLKYIGNGRLGTPALSIRQAYQEILDFEHAAEDGFRDVGCALAAEDDDTFEEYRKSLIKTEEVTDRYEYEIASFLSDISSEQMTGQETEETRVLYRVIGELESLGDSCENISRLLSRLRAHKQEFDSGTMEKLKEMIGLVENAMATMGINLKSASAGSLTDITNAYEAEDAINSARDTFRDEAFVQIEQQEGNYLSLNYFLDFIEELEAMGDFIINVSQAVVRTEE